MVEYKTDKSHQVIQEHTLERHKEKLREQGWEYLDGYTCNKSLMRVRCMKCGEIREVTGDYVSRKPTEGKFTRINCWNCNKQETEKKKALKRLCKELQKVAKKKTPKPPKPKKLVTFVFKECKECGDIFEARHKLMSYCSGNCRRRHTNRIGYQKRVKKLNHEGADKNITIEKLYKLNDGICYLCGGKCDWDDYVIKDGTIVAGNMYPSIEHVVPLSKGGEHVWGNVKLAHRRCNSLKRDRPYLPQPRLVPGTE